MNTQREQTTAERPAGSVVLWWDLGVAMMLAVLVLMVQFLVHDPSPLWAGDMRVAARRGLLLAPLAGFAVLYCTVGRTALRRAMLDEAVGAPGAVFRWLLLAAIGWAVFTEPMFALLQALAYPMVWTLVARYRDAVLWSAGVAVTVGASMFAGIAVVSPGAGLLSAMFSGPLSFVFAVVMGTWITRIFAQGERYRELAERLRASQAEVAELSQEAGASAERERLSRELHDTLTQTLAGLVMLSEQADRALAAGDTARARDRLARVDSAAREAVGEARALVATTQPLGDGGLEAAISRVVGRLRADAGLDVECELEPVQLDRERQVVLLRAAQEGLANARRHAHASRVRVRLETQPGGGALLCVDDDGVGPPGAAASAGEDGLAEAQRFQAARGSATAGFGLSGLADRVRGVGGAVAFGESPLGGARLEVRIDAGAEVQRGEQGAIRPRAQDEARHGMQGEAQQRGGAS